MRDRETPLKLVRLWPDIAPGCYDALDHCYGAKLDGEMYWPNYCPLPISAAFTYLVNEQKVEPQDAAQGCAELTACWAWRKNKVVYRFDPDLAQALADQAEDLTDTDVLPADTLMHLPYPCIYIKAPGVLEHMDGFWAWMEYDMNREAPELRVQWVFDDFQYSLPQVMHILPEKTIRECAWDTMQTTLEHVREPVDVSNPTESVRIVLKAIQLILYIAAANADIEDEPAPVEIKMVKASAPAKPKRPGIQDKASEIQAKDVGFRIGAAFRRSAGQRKSAGSGGGTAKRPHMRRGHWHHYWRGPMGGNRELILMWTAPTMIHADADQGDNVIIYPVKKT